MRCGSIGYLQTSARAGYQCSNRHVRASGLVQWRPRTLTVQPYALFRHGSRIPINHGGKVRRWTSSSTLPIVTGLKTEKNGAPRSSQPGTGGVAGAHVSRDPLEQRGWSTPLAKIIADAIEVCASYLETYGPF